MSKKFKKITAFFITLMLVGLMPFVSGHNTACAAEDEDFKIEVHYGYNDSIQVRCYVPFYITIENTGDNFEGTVQIIIPENDYNVMYEKDISLAKGTKKTVVLTVPVHRYTDKVNVRIVNQKDKVVFSETEKCNVLYSLKELNIGVLSDDFTALSYMSGQAIFSYSDITTKIYELTQETMPEDWKALQMLDAVVISDYSTDKLTQAQVEALGTWVEEGGLLLIGTGSTAGKTLSALNGNIADVKTGELKKYSTKFGYSLVSYMTDSITDSDMGYYYFEISDIAADTINKLVEEYVNTVMNAQQSALAGFDYDAMFYEFFELNKDTIVQLCRADFVKSFYGTSSLPDSEWENYGVEELYYSLSSMFEKRFTIAWENKLAELLSATAGSLSFVEADVLELEVAKDGGTYTMFYGETAQQDKLFTLVTAVSKGEGYVAVAGIDFTQNPFCTYKGNSIIFTNIVKTLIGQKVYEEANEYSADYYYDNNFDYYISNVVEMAASAYAPPVLLYVIIIGIYLILCLILFFVFKKKRKNMLLWLAWPVLSLTFAFIIYIAGFTTRTVKPELNVVVLTELDGNCEKISTYATLTMPKNKNYRLTLNKDYTVELARLYNRGYYYSSSSQNNLESYYIGFNTGLDSTEVEISNSQSLSTESFELNGTAYVEEGFEFDFAEDEAQELRGTVTNNYGVTLESAFVYYNGMFYAVGDIADGETIEITNDTPSFYATRHYRYDDDYEAVFGESGDEFKMVLLGDVSKEVKQKQMERSFYDYAKYYLIYGGESGITKSYYYYDAYYEGAILFGFPSEIRNRSVLTDDEIKENIFEMVYVKVSADKIKNSSVSEYKYYYD